MNPNPSAGPRLPKGLRLRVVLYSLLRTMQEALPTLSLFLTGNLERDI